MAKGFPDPPANWGHKDFSLSHVYPSRYCRAQPTGLTCATERNSSGAWNRSGTCPRLSMWALPRVLCFQSSLPPPLVHQIRVIHLTLPVPCRIWHACWPRPQDNPVRPYPWTYIGWSGVLFGTIRTQDRKFYSKMWSAGLLPSSFVFLWFEQGCCFSHIMSLLWVKW